MSSFLGIDSDIWVIILTIIIAIETLYLIIQGKRKSSSGIDPTTADLFDKMLKKIPAAETEKDDFTKMADQKTDEKIENIRKEFNKEIDAKFLETDLRTTKTEAQIKVLQDSVQQILDRAITESSTAEKEAVAETLETRVFVGIFKATRLFGKNTISTEDLNSYIYWMSDQYSNLKTISKILIHLRDKGMIFLPDGVKELDDISWNTPIGLTSKGEEMVEEEISSVLWGNI